MQAIFIYSSTLPTNPDATLTTIHLTSQTSIVLVKLEGGGKIMLVRMVGTGRLALAPPMTEGFDTLGQRQIGECLAKQRQRLPVRTRPQ